MPFIHLAFLDLVFGLLVTEEGALSPLYLNSSSHKRECPPEMLKWHLERNPGSGNMFIRVLSGKLNETKKRIGYHPPSHLPTLWTGWTEGVLRFFRLLGNTFHPSIDLTEREALASGAFGAVYKIPNPYNPGEKHVLKTMKQESQDETRNRFYDVFLEVFVAGPSHYQTHFLCPLFDYGLERTGFWMNFDK